MVLFDTNILIYLANGKLDRTKVYNIEVAYASISRIETLGYPLIMVQEDRLIRRLLGAYEELPLDEAVIQRAISIKQYKKIKLGDAIIAATALEYKLKLWTANIKDFKDIEDIELYDPLNHEAL